MRDNGYSRRLSSSLQSAGLPVDLKTDALRAPVFHKTIRRRTHKTQIGGAWLVMTTRQFDVGAANIQKPPMHAAAKATPGRTHE